MNGTLSWTINQSGGACGFEGQSQWQQWNYSNFQYTPQGGSSLPLSGSAVSFDSPGGNCPPNGGITTTIGNIPTAVGIYAINFTSEPGGDGYGTPVQTGATEVLNPAYQVVSIIYSTPGNTSSNGFTDTTSNGTTTTIGNSFANGSSITFTHGFSLWGFAHMSVSATGGNSNTSLNSSAFTESFTDASGMSNESKPQDSNNIDHSQDQIAIWLNPQVTVTGINGIPEYYSVSVQPTADGSNPGADIVTISANVMEANADGVSTVPQTWLNPQTYTDPDTGQLVTLPGLAAICKNLNVDEYKAGQCTLADQCGCTPTDFAPILAQDALLYYNGSQNPLDANNSPPSVCGTLPTPAGSDCRYVPVPEVTGSTVQEVKPLSGPDSSNSNYSCDSFQQGENTNTVNTLGGSSSQSVGVSVTAGAFGFHLTVANTWTWTQQQSTGTANGTGVTQQVNLCSNTTGCGEQIPIFEDTLYHTFVFMGGSSSCP